MSIATVSGMDRVTGAALSGRAHMRQSIMDILTTPIGSRTTMPTFPGPDGESWS